MPWYGLQNLQISDQKSLIFRHKFGLEIKANKYFISVRAVERKMAF